MDTVEMCRDWLRRKALFLDTETTGLDEQAEVVELAILDHQGNPKWEGLIRPTVPITPKLTEIHGISNDMVADAPTWADVHGEIWEILAGNLIVTYNAEFDARIIRQTCALHGLRGYAAEWACAMQMYQDHTGNHKWIKLVDAAAECGVDPVGQAHRAATDALMCLQIVQKIAWF
jgi:DNA polymerase-3 subunit epsilon